MLTPWHIWRHVHIQSMCIFWVRVLKVGHRPLCVFLCRYHYYGIAVKETSQYYDVMYSKKGAAWVNETGKKEVTKQTVAYSPRSKLGTLLPEFPNVKDLNLPASLPEERVNSTFKSPSLQLSPAPSLPPSSISSHLSLPSRHPCAPSGSSLLSAPGPSLGLHSGKDLEDLYAGSSLTLNLSGEIIRSSYGQRTGTSCPAFKEGPWF